MKEEARVRFCMSIMRRAVLVGEMRMGLISQGSVMLGAGEEEGEEVGWVRSHVEGGDQVHELDGWPTVIEDDGGVGGGFPWG